MSDDTTRKTFQDGAWRVLFRDGTFGKKCDAPTAKERQQWATEDQEQEVAPFVTPKVFIEPAFGTSRWHWRNPDGSTGEKCPPPTEAEVEEWERKSTPFPAVTDAPPPGTKVYKVVTQRDEFFGGQFDPGKLTQLMNQLALDGWRVIAITTADVSTFWGTFWAGREAREELIVFLEKTV